MARKRSRKRSTLVDFVDAVTGFGLKIGAAAFVVVLGYLIYGLVSRGGIPRLASLSEGDRIRVIRNVAAACKALSISGAVTALCAAARYYAEESLGYLMSLLGVLLYLAVPWWMSAAFSSSELKANLAIATVVSEFQLLGIIFFVIGSALIVRDVALRITLSLYERERKKSTFQVGEQAAAREEPYRPRLYPKCWQMPFCRAFVRNVCPAYESRKSCWRLKAGCMCDEDIIMRALKSQSSEGRMFAKDLRYRLGQLPQKSALTAAQKRERCRNCVIFRSHQEQKYRLVSPLVFPAVGALIWALYPRIEALFRLMVRATDEFMKTVTFLPQSSERTAGAGSVPEFVLVLFVAWLAIVAVSYSLQLVEFCIFKIQI